MTEEKNVQTSSEESPESPVPSADPISPQTAEQSPQTPIPLYEEKVFGMNRLPFYGILLGYGGGLVAAGLFGIITGIEVTSAAMSGIIGSIIGYCIGWYLTRHLRTKAKEKQQDS